PKRKKQIGGAIAGYGPIQRPGNGRQRKPQPALRGEHGGPFLDLDSVHPASKCRPPWRNSNPKSEIPRPKEIRITKSEPPPARFRSGFGLRISDLGVSSWLFYPSHLFSPHGNSQPQTRRLLPI